MSLLKIIITLVVLSIAANAKVTFKINHKTQIINIVDTEDNKNIVTSIHNITTQQFIHRFERSFYVYISTLREKIKIDENMFNEINNELMKN